MTTQVKSDNAAKQIQEILDAYHLANSQNVRLRAEVATLRSKVRQLESLNEKTETDEVTRTEPATAHHEDWAVG